MTDTADLVERRPVGRRDVMSAVGTIDSADHLIVANITRDDAWLAMGMDATVSTDEWR